MFFALYLIISLILSLALYVSTANYYFAGGFFLLFVLYYFLYLSRCIKRYKEKISKIHECYEFINNFTIALKVKNTLSGAFESVQYSFSPRLKEEMKGITHLTDIEKIEYLKGYYSLSIYDVLVNILILYIEQGGDILKMSELIVDEARKLEENLNSTISHGKRVAFNYITLWLLTIGIIIFCRFAIQDFYTSMLSSVYFPYLILGFFLFVFLAFHIFIYRYTNLDPLGA